MDCESPHLYQSKRKLWQFMLSFYNISNVTVGKSYPCAALHGDFCASIFYNYFTCAFKGNLVTCNSKQDQCLTARSFPRRLELTSPSLQITIIAELWWSL